MLVFNYLESFQLPWSFSFLSLQRRVSRRPRGSAGAVRGAGAHPGPCPNPLDAAAPVQRLRANRGVPGEPHVARRVRVSARGAMSRDMRGGTTCARSATPSGTIDPCQRSPGGNRWCSEATCAVGTGLLASAAGCGEPRAQPEGVQPQPTLLLPYTSKWHLLPRPNHLVAKVASPTSAPHHTQPERFLDYGPFLSWVIGCSWISFPTANSISCSFLSALGVIQAGVK